MCLEYVLDGSKDAENAYSCLCAGVYYNEFNRA
jgi:hypothetical protein